MKTSTSHPLLIDFLSVGPSGGRLGLTFCPGKHQRSAYSGAWARDLEVDLNAIAEWGATHLVTLVEADELVGLRVPPEALASGCAARGTAWHHLPIRDAGVPGDEFEREWAAGVGAMLRRALRDGDAVVVHCKGGLGRTGLVAGRLLVELGEMDGEAAIEAVRRARPGAIENWAQEEVVRSARVVSDGVVSDGVVVEGAGDDEAGDDEVMEAGVSEELVERARGCFLAGAVGDALGAGIEFLSLGEIRRRFGADGVTGYVEAYGRLGAITDDTQMLLFTAEGLIRAWVRGKEGGIWDPPSVVWHAYQRWHHTQGVPWAKCIRAWAVEEGPDGWLIEQRSLFSRRAPGNTCLSALRTRSTNEDLLSPINDSKGCGGVMRVAPVGFVRDPSCDVFRLGSEVAAITHSHPTGHLAAGAMAVMVERLAVGEELDAAIEAARERLAREPGHRETSAAIVRALGAAGNVPSAEVVEAIGGGWVAEEALAMSIYCARAYAAVADPVERMRRSLLLAVNHSGDSDSTGAITGNLLGTLLGAAAIPSEWLKGLELREVIEAVAVDLVTEMGRTGESSAGLFERYPGW